METPETLAEDPPPPSQNPADSLPPAPQPAERLLPVEPPPSTGSRRGRPRRGARVSPDPAVGEPMVAPDSAGRCGGGLGAFRAEDLVWVKLRIRDWWPGVVLDPSSPEHAAEAKRRGGGAGEDRPAVLVAPFGDAAVAWFEVSQVKPFGEGLPAMLRQSGSVSLGRAIRDALFELEKRLLVEMSCYCSPDGKCEASERAGKCSVTNYLPSEFYDHLLDASQNVLNADVLDVVLLRCWALALQSCTRSSTNLVSRMQSPNELVDTDYSDAPLHDDSATDEGGVDCEVNFSRAVKGPEISEVSKHKKERSIAELIAEGSEATEPPANGVKTAALDKPCLSSSSSESRKRDSKGERRKKFEAEEEGTIDTVEEKTIEFDKLDPSSVSLAKKTSKSVKRQSSYTKNDGDLVELETRSSGRERKRSKYLSPPYAYEIGYVKRSFALNSFALNNEAAERPDTSSEASQSFCTKSSPGSISQVLKKEDDKADAVSDGDRNSTDRILSAFLLAAADPLHQKWNRSTDAVRDFFHKFRSSVYSSGTDFLSYDKFLSDSANRCERPLDSCMDGSEKDKSTKEMNKPASSVGNESPIDKDDDASSPTDTGKVQKRRKTRHKGARDEMTVTRENGTDTANDIKEDNRSQRREMRKASCGSAKDAIHMHHEFKNDAGGDKSRIEKGTASDAKSSSDTFTGLAAHSEPNSLSSKRRKGRTEGNIVRTSEVDCQHTSASLEAGSKHKRNKQEQSNGQNAVSLILTFAPGTALPTKADIISRFSIYGPLVEAQTDIMQDSHRFRVAFEHDMDAEDAFKSLDSIGSLASSIANYELQDPGTISSSNAPETPLPYIRKNLQRMISKLTGFRESEKEAQSSNNLCPEITDNLVGEMDGLLKKVNKLLTGPSVTI